MELMTTCELMFLSLSLELFYLLELQLPLLVSARLVPIGPQLNRAHALLQYTWAGNVFRFQKQGSKVHQVKVLRANLNNSHQRLERLLHESPVLKELDFSR